MNPVLDNSTFWLWVYFERELESGTTWVAHILDLDIVTQGESLQDAIFMARDAVLIVLGESLSSDSLAQLMSRSAPDEDWAKLWELFELGPACRLEAILESEQDYLAMGTQIRFSVADVFSSAPPGYKPSSTLPNMPIGAVRKGAGPA